MYYSFILFIRYQENHILENARTIPHVAANVATIIPPYLKQLQTEITSLCYRLSLLIRRVYRKLTQ